MTKQYETIQRGTTEFPVGIFAQTIYLNEPHHHVEYELLLISEGRAVIGIEGHEYPLKAGDAVFLEPGTIHYARSVVDGEIYRYNAIIFSDAILGNENDPCRIFFEGIRINRFPAIPESLCDDIRYASRLEADGTEGRQIQIKACLLSLIAHFIRTGQYKKVSPLDSYKRHSRNTIDSVLTYVQEHFRENITLESLLEITHYSKSYFIRLFHDNVGMGLTEYVNKYRIEKSCLDMLYTDKNITEVASSNGFNNIQYFSRVFKKYMGCTPKQYQKNLKGNIIQAGIP